MSSSNKNRLRIRTIQQVADRVDILHKMTQVIVVFIHRHSLRDFMLEKNETVIFYRDLTTSVSVTDRNGLKQLKLQIEVAFCFVISYSFDIL